MIRLESQILNELTEFRRALHSHPEISGEESETAKRVISFLQGFGPDRIIKNIGGHGLLAEFRGRSKGPTVMFRCELDALPLEENNKIPYRSAYPGKAHLCGHDGHMAMIAGLASCLKNARPLKGRVILLFQPSEEDGKGALRIIGDPRFKDHEPDHIFAIHNLPSFPLHKVVVSNKNFASASSGMRIDLFGKTSHAAEPEKGKNPGIGMARMILGAQDLLKANNNFRDFVLLTPIHAVLGKLAYGTTPGRANLNFTLRSFQDTDMEMLKSEIEWLVHSIATQEHLNLEISYEEEFPATANHPHEVKLIKKITALKGMDLHNLRKPFKWSEDFGHFLARYPGALIGLGSGTDQPALHNPDYDFPDEIIPTGIRVFQGLYDHILNQ